MAGEMIKEFLVGLGFNVDQQGLAKFTQGITSATVRATALWTVLSTSVPTFGAFIRHVAAEIDQLDKLASRFRTTADAIDEFVDAAGILGISEETSIESLKNLDRAIADTAMGMGRAKVVFEELGISVTDASGKLKSTTEVMMELAGKFKDMDRAKQIRLMERLGLDPALLKLFNEDLEKINQELKEIDKSADFDLEKSIEESKSFMKVWRELQKEVQYWKTLISKAFQSLSVKLMPIFRERIKSITQGLVDMRKKLMENMPKIIETLLPILPILMKISAAFVQLVARLAQGAAWIIQKFIALNTATNGWIGYIMLAAAAWKYLNLSFLKTPLGKLLLLGVVILALVDDFMTFKEGGNSLIDWSNGWVKILLALVAVIGSVATAMGIVKVATLGWSAAVAGWNAIQVISNSIMAAARTAVLAFNLIMAANPIYLVVAAVAALVAAGALLIANWETVKTWFSSFFDWFSKGFDKVSEIAGKVVGMFGGGGGAPASAPSPQAAAAVTGGGQNVNQSTQIVVQGATNPEATAKAVAGQQGRVNADMARNMKGAAR